MTKKCFLSFFVQPFFNIILQFFSNDIEKPEIRCSELVSAAKLTIKIENSEIKTKITSIWLLKIIGKCTKMNDGTIHLKRFGFICR